MADKNSGWKCTHSAWIQSQTDTTATIRVVVNWQNVNWTYNINFVSAWVYCNGSEYKVFDNGNVNAKADMNQTLQLGYHDFVINKGTSGQNISCYAKITSNSSYVSGDRWSEAANVWIDAKPSYTVSYNLNGGSGSFGNQTKWYGTDLKLHTASPTRTGYSFVRWNTNTSNTGTGYAPGVNYTGNSNLTLYAIWKANTYTVTYNANGGTGAPGNQTKTYGVDLILSSTKPTRTNYNFLGWATSASGNVVYAAGAKYTNNSAVTLYAVWELAYAKPRITNFAANRCTSNGTISETGTYVKVTFNWTTDKTVTAVKIQHKLQTTTTWTTTNVTASGTSGSVSQVIGGGAISTESSYHVRAYVADGSGDTYTTYSTQASIGTVKFPIDVKAGGKGVAIGKVAETDNLLDIGWDVKFRGDAQANIKVVSQCGSNTEGTKGWYKVASSTMSGYGNTNLLYYIRAGYSSGWYGMLELEIRADNTSISCWKCEWVLRSGFNTNHVRVVISGMTWTLYVYNPSNRYGRVYFSEIQHRSLGGDKPSFTVTYYNSSAPESAEPTASVDTTELVSKLSPYPVGSIYICWTRAKTPAELFGGTWVQMTGGFLYGSTVTATTGTGSTGNGTGTSTKAHAITTDQMPSHTHGQDAHSHQINEVNGDNNIIASGGYNNNGNKWGANFIYGGQPGAWGFTNVSNFYTRSSQPGIWSTGGGQGHSHGVPYMAVFIWRRTA